MHEKKTVNQEFYIQQNYPSKNRGKIKISPNKQKLSGFVPEKLLCKKYKRES